MRACTAGLAITPQPGIGDTPSGPREGLRWPGRIRRPGRGDADGMACLRSNADPEVLSG